jgi:hypothetical protein
MIPFGQDPERPANPLSDEQTKAEVLDPARQITTIANLQNVSGVFGWESCNDQGDRPFRGRVEVSFDVPAGADRKAASSTPAASWRSSARAAEQPKTVRSSSPASAATWVLTATTAPGTTSPTS